MSTNNKISNLISSQVPFFVRNDHPNFVAFLEAYYQYLEQEGITLEQGQVVERAKNLPNYFDVDRTLDEFSELLYNHFLKFLPREIIADKDLLIKHVLDFYKARGTEKSTRFLFNILFNKPITFYYPKRDVLKASDGKWIFDKYLNIIDMKVSNVANSQLGATQKLINTKVYGRQSKATAVVDDVIRFTSQGSTIDKLQISSLRGVFVPGEEIITRRSGDLEFLSATLTNNSVASITITDQGAGYNVGDYINAVSNTGSGANIVITAVSQGEMIDLLVNFGGAGFQVENPIVLSSISGVNAQAAIVSVDSSGYYHSNTYNVWYTPMSVEANTPMNGVYANLYTGIVSSPNANSVMAHVLPTYKITGLGPISDVDVTAVGGRYSSPPSVDVTANTLLRSIGSLGRMAIVRAGSGYQIGNIINFTNLPGKPGFGANAIVSNVSITGGITKVSWTPYNSEPIGGSGYTDFPTTTITSANGVGGLVSVTAIMGDSEVLSPIIDIFGKIKNVAIIDNGAGYSDIILDLTGHGDGTATAEATLSAAREDGFKRYFNDDGMISSYNFLQNRDYYMNYSYVISVRESIKSYKEAVKNLLHPSGMKLFGEYDYQANNLTLPMANVQVSEVAHNPLSIRFADFSYEANANLAMITLKSHGYLANNNVYVEFLTTNELSSGSYFVDNAAANTFNVTIAQASTTANGRAIVYAQVV